MPARLSFILLAHEHPSDLRSLIETLLSSGCNVFLNHDSKQGINFGSSIAEWGLESLVGKLYIVEPIKVTWGEWSIVQATLNCLNHALKQNDQADYYMLISGSCFPIKPISLLKSFLAKRRGMEFIEASSFDLKRWGYSNSYRYDYYHFFNWRKHPKLFNFSIEFQKRLGIFRSIPMQHKPYEGSQWWCLTAETIKNILELVSKNKNLTSFYRRTWLPDEFFFQTLVSNIVPHEKLSKNIPTFYKFNSWGVPRVFYDDDFEELVLLEHFFARKISYRAIELRHKLSDLAKVSSINFKKIIHNAHIGFGATSDFLKITSKNSWYSLAASTDNQYDYIKSIPNPILVVVGGNCFMRKKFVSLVSKLENVAMDDDKSEANSRFNSDYWYLRMGDFAIRNSGKLITFSLNENVISILNVIRWKKDLAIVYLNCPKRKTTRPINKILYKVNDTSFILSVLDVWEKNSDYHCLTFKVNTIDKSHVEDIYNRLMNRFSEVSY